MMIPNEYIECKEVIEALERELAEAQAEIERLNEAFGYTYCAYCGEKFAVDAPDSTDAVGRHIKACEKHPIFQLTKAIAERDKLIEQMRDAYAEISTQYKPSYHDCVDDGLSECGWCRMEAAFEATLSAAERMKNND